MHVVTSFDYSTYLEIALVELDNLGIPNERIVAVPLETAPGKQRLLDSIHRSDGGSILDLGMAVGTATSVVTASLGMTYRWGPVYWGLIGAAGGFLVGLAIDLMIGRRRRAAKRQRISEVVVVVECGDSSPTVIADLLWKHKALGVAVVSGQPNSTLQRSEWSERSEEAELSLPRRRRPVL
ncbi:hypothetical protein MO973_07835 [Paenibacillus sp. TRM 82003]|nr:hypothetical protein [Paenibacillus sp. TRM 82003]